MYRYPTVNTQSRTSGGKPIYGTKRYKKRDKMTRKRGGDKKNKDKYKDKNKNKYKDKHKNYY